VLAHAHREPVAAEVGVVHSGEDGDEEADREGECGVGGW